VVEPGWALEVTSRDHVVLTRVAKLPDRVALGTTCDPILLEIFNNLFMTIAEQMGVTLQNTAYSVNVKERLDFSCAVFDAGGGLIANAPHMPVHLGSMGESVRTIIRLRRHHAQGATSIALNNPYNGGTHLPDVTTVMPIFSETGDVLFYTASRAHHADIGGITPGSMPPFSKHIDEEGVLFDNFHLVDQGRFCHDEVQALLESGPYPARNPAPEHRRPPGPGGKLRQGAAELDRMVAQFGIDTVQAYMAHVMDNAEESVRRVIDRLKDGQFTYAHDQGPVITVKVTVDKASRSARIDFTGTSPQQDWNFNAPAAVTRAAVLYVFRTLVDNDIPLNDGCLKPLELIIPEGSVLACKHPAAVCAGNVETSQWCTDTLFGALGVLAAAQGTMNNFTFGNANTSTTRPSAAARCRPRPPRHLGRAHPHDQLAAHRPRDPRMALPRPARGAPHPPRVGRRRPVHRRRRHAAAHPLPRAHGGRPPFQPPQGPSLRPRRRRRRSMRRPVGRAGGRHGREARRL
jgi:5-oxoprolinase (ATP-hydrolysing)